MVVVKCDVCAREGALRFSLIRRASDRVTRGAGGIHLCQACWDELARPRMRRIRPPAHPGQPDP